MSVSIRLASVGLCLASGVWFAVARPAYAQPSDGPADAATQEERLTEERDIEKLRAEIAEQKKLRAQAEAAEAAAGGSGTRGLPGDVTVGAGAGYFAEVLAYQSVRSAAEAIADATHKGAGTGTRIIVVDRLDLNAERARWRVISLRLSRFESVIGDLRDVLQRGHADICEAPGRAKSARESRAAAEQARDTSVTGLVSAAAGLGALADVAGFFRTDAELAAYAVDLSDRALLASVAEALLKLDHPVLVPTIHADEAGTILRRTEDLQQRALRLSEPQSHIELCTRQAFEEVQKLEVRLAVYERAKNVPKIEATLTALENARISPKYRLRTFADREIAAVRGAVDGFLASLVTPAASGQPSPIESITTVDVIKRHEDAMLLYVDVVDSGGEVHVSKSIWTGGKVSYVGGNTSVYFLTNSTGMLAATAARTGYLRGWYGNRGGVKGLKLDRSSAEDLTPGKDSSVGGGD